jgi:hypothetical protein
MQKSDIADLTKLERRLLEDAFHEGNSPRRTRGVVLSAAVVLVAVALFVGFGASVIFLAGLAVSTVLVSASEKLVYQRNMESYESLVRKLVNQLEVVERVPLSKTVPAESPPAISVTDTGLRQKTQRMMVAYADVPAPSRR